MNVCHIITTIDKGGAENQLSILVRHQVESGLRVTVIPLKGKLEMKEELEKSGAEVKTDLLDICFMKQILKGRKMKLDSNDVIHCHLPQAELLQKFLGLKNVVVSRHFGGAFFPNRNALFSRALSRFATRSVFYVIAISKSVAKTLNDLKEIVDSEKIIVIPYGYKSEPIHLKNSLMYPSQLSPENGTVFGTLARLAPEKDLGTLITAFYIHQKNREFEKDTLQIFGEGNSRASLEMLISKLGIEKKVVLNGKTLFPQEAMRSIDVFVLTSKFEGFGMVLLEAMEQRKPIICSNIDTAQEVLGINGAGIFFEVGNAEDLASKMNHVYNILNARYQEAQMDQLQIFNSMEMAHRIHDLYLDVNEEKKNAKK